MATNGSSARWAPPPGRHKVDVGGSLKRALRARKGIVPPTTTTNKNMPVSDYYLFRYNFKPESVDTSKPGVVEVKRGKEATKVQVERPSAQSEEVHVFRGHEEPSKEIECVLIYDEETNTFTLEKLDSSLNLTHEGKSRSKARVPSASPHTNTPSPAASTSKIIDPDPEEEVERELLNAVGGGDAKADARRRPPPSMDVDDLDEILEQAFIPSTKPAAAAAAAKSSSKKASGTKAKKQKAPPPAPPPPLPQTANVVPVQPVPAPATVSSKRRPILKGTPTTTPPPPPLLPKKPAAAPPVKASTSTPRVAAPKFKARSAPEPAPEPAVEVEVLEFGRPATQARTVAPEKASPTDGLALPFSGSSAFMPGPLASSSSRSTAAAAAAPQPLVVDDDDDDDWDVVAGAAAEPSPVLQAPVSGATEILPLDASSFGGAEPTGDLIDQFAADLDLQLLEGLEGLEEDDGDADADDGDEDMFGDDAYAEAEASAAAAAAKGKPMSLNQFAGGGETGLDDQDDDDYSSSEESDDE